MSFSDKYYYPQYDYDNTLWQWINIALIDTNWRSVEKLLKLVRMMWSAKDQEAYKAIEKEIEEMEKEIMEKTEEEMEEKLVNYRKNDDYFYAVRKNAQRKAEEEIDEKKANKVLDFILTSDCVKDSFRRREARGYAAAVRPPRQ